MSGTTSTIQGFAFAAALALVLPTQALPQEAPKAGVVTTLQGTASVARSTQEPRPLKFKDDVFVQDRITTGDDSIVRILLGGKAVVTVRERSVLTISETPTTATRSRSRRRTRSPASAAPSSSPRCPRIWPAGPTRSSPCSRASWTSRGSTPPPAGRLAPA